ncbi:AAA family ATPase [Burkholderia cepacia]|uniref:AAA family ATPase n=1 Tax=Burkholderia cepacia TaxID=292 RepID=UPI0026DFE526|nr:AAA family ATPase [Burkholderia cepacia]MDO5943382.1 AAA family ATPase [Burkholderia cepacia]
MPYLVKLLNIMNDPEYKEYLSASAAYYVEQMKRAVSTHLPHLDVSKLDYNNLPDEVLAVIDKIPFKVNVMGNLAKTMGLDKVVMTPELLNHVLNGYLPVDVLPENSHLRAYAIKTELGNMLPLNNNKSKIVDGQYVANGEKRVSTEMLFTLGKRESIYLMSLAMDDPDVLRQAQEDHQREMSTHFMPELEKLARIRIQDETGETVPADAFQLAIISVMHIEERAGQIHIHWHDQIVNTAMSADGRLYALDADDIFKAKAYLDSVYMGNRKDGMEQRYNVRYQPVYVKKDANNEHLPDNEKVVASYDLASDIVPDEVVEHFSKRGDEIAQELKRLGLADTPQAREIAQKSSRSDKAEISPYEYLEIWREEFKKVGYKAQRYAIPLNNKTEEPAISNEQTSMNFQRKHHEEKMARYVAVYENVGKPSNKKISARLAKKKSKQQKQELHALKMAHIQSVLKDVEVAPLVKSFNDKTGTVAFNIHQFRAHNIKQLLNTCSTGRAREIAEAIVEDQCVLYMDPKNPHYDEIMAYSRGEITDPQKKRQAEIKFQRHAEFITKPVIEAHNRIYKGALARKDETQFIIDQRIINKHIMLYEKRKGFTLSADQIELINVGAKSPGAFLTAIGEAGTGKTTAAEVLAAIWKECGYRVIATSISSEATKGIGKSINAAPEDCMNTTVLQRGLDEGKIKLDEKTIVLWDEAAMGDIFTYDKIFAHVNKAKAKCVMMGDPNQVQPIGAGNIFKFLNEKFISASLTSVNRQNTKEKREVGKLWRVGKALDALEKYKEWGWIEEASNIQVAWEKAATNYVNNVIAEQPISMTSMADTNVDNDSINALIKQKFRDLWVEAHSAGVSEERRKLLLERGALNPQAETHKLKCSDDIEREFSVGDKVVFFKATKANNANPDDARINNSQTGRVKYFSKMMSGRMAAVCIELDEIDPRTKEKRLVFLSSEKLMNIRHGWSGTVYKAQGGSFDKTVRVPSISTPLNAFIEYVASTRFKDEHRLIIPAELKDKWLRQSYEYEISEKQALKLKWLKEHKAVDVPDLAYESYGHAAKFLAKHKDTHQPGNPWTIADEYADLIKRLSELPYKKNVSDYVEVPNGLDLLKNLMTNRVKEYEFFNAHTDDLTPVAKPKPANREFTRDSSAAIHVKAAAAVRRPKKKVRPIVATPEAQKTPQNVPTPQAPAPAIKQAKKNVQVLKR